MKRIRIISLPLMAIVLLVLACGPTISPEGTLPPEDAANTAVALTQTAQAQETEAAAPATDTQGPPATDTPIPTPTNTPIPSPTPFCDRAAFVSESIPDGMDFEPDTAFTKSWRLENAGACTWTSGYSLVFDHGDLLSAPIEVPLPGSVAPGQEVDISVDMVAPSGEGTYTGHWMLRNDSGVLFGLGSSATLTFWVEIDVVEPPPIVMIIPGLIQPIFPGWLLPRTERVTGSATIGASSNGYAEVNCPSGSLAVGGGFAAQNGLLVYNSTPKAGGWRSYARNTTGSNRQLTVYAVCLYNSGGTVTWESNNEIVHAGSSQRSEAICPSGSIVTGGGFASDPDNHWVYATKKSSTGWETWAHNDTATDKQMSSYAVCLSDVSATTTQVLEQMIIPGNSSTGGERPCPANTLLTGGGYYLGTGLEVYNTSMKGADSDIWNVFARNTLPAPRWLNIYAVCLSFQ
jgi:hypothetical protein